MEILVCVKRVPDTTEADLEINSTKLDIKHDSLVYDINEWDKYAVEEAVLLKEKYGGSVTVLSVGNEDVEDTLRRCFATGADAGIRLTDEAFSGSDCYALAQILAAAIKDLKYDLILTGVQSGDYGDAQIGPILAELLGLPYATLVIGIKIDEQKALVERELEDGINEILEVELPAVLSIQSGINEPRYVSIMGVRKASSKEIKTMNLAETGLNSDVVGYTGAKVKVRKLFFPEITHEPEMLPKNTDEATTRLVQILKEKGII